MDEEDGSHGGRRYAGPVCAEGTAGARRQQVRLSAAVPIRESFETTRAPQRLITVQVTVRTMPSISWIRLTILRRRSSIESVSARTIKS